VPEPHIFTEFGIFTVEKAAPRFIDENARDKGSGTAIDGSLSPTPGRNQRFIMLAHQRMGEAVKRRFGSTASPAHGTTTTRKLLRFPARGIGH
jgi:hypothetical protein